MKLIVLLTTLLIFSAAQAKVEITMWDCMNTDKTIKTNVYLKNEVPDLFTIIRKKKNGEARSDSFDKIEDLTEDGEGLHIVALNRINLPRAELTISTHFDKINGGMVGTLLLPALVKPKKVVVYCLAELEDME